MNMNIEKNRSTYTQPTINTNAATPSTTVNADAVVPLSAGGEDKAATFEKTKSAKGKGGDSRVVSPAGGGFGAISNQSAIDAHSKKAGDFTDMRIVDGQPLFFTPDGARAVDTMVERAAESSAPLHARRDPTFVEKWLSGDLFEGLEQYSGKTK